MISISKKPFGLHGLCKNMAYANKGRWTNVGSELAHRLRRWTNIEPTLVQRWFNADATLILKQRYRWWANPETITGLMGPKNPGNIESKSLEYH